MREGYKTIKITGGFTMEITDVRVRKIDSNKLVGVATITLDNNFAVHDIKIIRNNEKLFISMPSRKTPDGEFKDIAHPINQTFRDELTELILNKFESLE